MHAAGTDAEMFFMNTCQHFRYGYLLGGAFADVWAFIYFNKIKRARGHLHCSTEHK